MYQWHNLLCLLEFPGQYFGLSLVSQFLKQAGKLALIFPLSDILANMTETRPNMFIRLGQFCAASKAYLPH